MIVNNVLLKLKNNDTENIKKAQEVLLDIQAEMNIRPSQTAYDIILITKFNECISYSSCALRSWKVYRRCSRHSNISML